MVGMERNVMVEIVVVEVISGFSVRWKCIGWSSIVSFSGLYRNVGTYKVLVVTGEIVKWL